MPFFKGTITKRVMAAIKERIAQAEAAFQQALEDLEGEHAQQIADLTTQQEAEKLHLENSTVDSLVGKILG